MASGGYLTAMSVSDTTIFIRLIFVCLQRSE